MNEPAVSPTELRIDFMKMRHVTDTGVRRACVFLGLVTNANAAEPAISHVLDDRVQYQFVPAKVPTAAAAHFREEFTYWVMGNALRELIDTFSAFLVRCRPALRMLEVKQITADEQAGFWNELRQLEAAIEQKSVSAQYAEIQSIVGLEGDYADMFETFRQARNCLAHRRGIVAQRDVNTDDEHFKIRWRYLGVFLRRQDATETLMDNDAIVAGVETGGNEGKIIIRPTWKEKKFPVGSQIRLTRHDLAEVCFAVHLATSHVVTKMHDFAAAHGIPEARLDQVQEAMREKPSDAAPSNIDRED